MCDPTIYYLLLVIFIVFVLLIILSSVNQGSAEGMSTVQSTATTQSPCPPGYSGAGTNASPCVNSGVGATGCQSKSFEFIDWNGQRQWATQCGITNWPGVLCPPGWTGNGTSLYPCINGGTGSLGATGCSQMSFDNDSYINNFGNVVRWADGCNVNWPGITCPKDWTGHGTASNRCNPPPQNKYCPPVAFDYGYTKYASVVDWANQCNNTGKQQGSTNPVVMYSAGVW
jgi:hypothetical protein